MNYFKNITVFLLFIFLSGSLLADGPKSGQFSKQGRFTKDNNFNKNGTRDLLPPDPGGGGDPNPLPAGEGFLILLAGSAIFVAYKINKNKKK